MRTPFEVSIFTDLQAFCEPERPVPHSFFLYIDLGFGQGDPAQGSFLLMVFEKARFHPLCFETAENPS